MDTIRQAYVEGVGPEREDRLFKAYSAWREAAEAHVRRLEDKELDLRVKGAFSDEQVDMLSAQAELDRKREALEVRRAALRQRAADAQLDVRTAHRPRIAKAVEPAAVSRVCPRCGGPLVRRRGRRGPFLGCSRYPSCRYSRDVD